METNRFDTIARLFAERKLSRRAALAKGSAGLAGGALAAAGLDRAAAQDATPVPPSPAEKVEFLFVQSFQRGSIAPKAGAEGRYTVTLEQGLGQTVYFSDRPDRVVGATPTDQFLRGIGFAADNPPNAALVVETAPGETDVAVVELFDPVFDPAGPGVTYDVAVLANWRASLELGFAEAPADLAALAPSFGPAHLFIDDCPDTDINCECIRDEKPFRRGVLPLVSNVGMCWNYSLCQPCEPYGHTLPSYCATYDYWKQRCKEAYPTPGLLCKPSWSWIMPPWCDVPGR
jgi:hypothetical protein